MNHLCILKPGYIIEGKKWIESKKAQSLYDNGLWSLCFQLSALFKILLHPFKETLFILSRTRFKVGGAL